MGKKLLVWEKGTTSLLNAMQLLVFKFLFSFGAGDITRMKEGDLFLDRDLSSCQRL